MSQDHEKIISLVRSSTSALISSFREKTMALRGLQPEIRQLIRQAYDPEKALSAAKSLFGEGRADYLAIDGTLAVDHQLDMAIFYSGAFGYRGTLTLDEGGCSSSEASELTEGASISSAIPIFEEDEARVSGQPTEGGVEIEPDRLPQVLMHLSEYYLAVRALESDPGIKVVIMDRTLAGDVGHLIWTVKERLESGQSILLGQETPGGRVSALDLELARMLHPDKGLGVPAARSHFIRYSAVGALAGVEEPLTPHGLLMRMGAQEGRLDKLNRELRELRERYDPFMSAAGYRLRPGVSGYWERVYAASMRLAGHIFDTPRGEHPLMYMREGARHWITACDVEYMTLIMIYRLLRLARERGVMAIGLVKDTSANELIRTVMPILRSSGKMKCTKMPSFNSDKALLQTASVIGGWEVRAPWRTIEFDACFRTMAPDEDLSLGSGEARVKGAYKNVVSDERVFVKSYVQLWQSDADPSVKSHVFSFDRPCYPGFDSPGEITVYHMDGAVDERILPIIHYERDCAVSHLVMAILHSMAQEAVPEALGHNYPLFLADKKAKAVLEGTRAAYLATVALESSKGEFDQQVLFNQKFRDFRSEIESARRAKR